MTKPRLSDYLDHIRQAANEAMEFVQGMNRHAFLEDRRTQRAVIQCLTVIGEVAARIMENHKEFAENHPGIPWKKMRGMRNRVVHSYFDINFDAVWDTVSVFLPALLSQLPISPVSDD